MCQTGQFGDEPELVVKDGDGETVTTIMLTVEQAGELAIALLCSERVKTHFTQARLIGRYGVTAS